VEEAEIEEASADVEEPIRLQSEEDIEEYQRLRRAAFATREATSRPQLSAAARRGFERGSHSLWSELMPNQLFTIDTELESGLLESATADTYIAIDARSLSP
jgi:hypothetical protein